MRRSSAEGNVSEALYANALSLDRLLALGTEPGFPGWVGQWLAFGPKSTYKFNGIAVSGRSDREVCDG